MAKIQTLAVGNTVLSTNLDNLQFVTSIPQEFEFSIVAGSNAGMMVVGSSEFSDKEALSKLEYYEVKDGTWKEFQGDFGSSSGFPLTDATSKFRATFKKAGEYTFEAFVKNVENSEKVATCTATAHVREYKKVELTSTFGEGTAKAGVPYNFNITFNPGDDASKEVAGKIEFSVPGLLEMKNGDEYTENNGIFDRIVLEQETNEFRYTPSVSGSSKMTFTLTDNDAEYVKMEKDLTVSEYVKAAVSIDMPVFEQNKEAELVIHVTANDDAGKRGTFKYVFSVPEAISHIEQYISDEASEFYNTWVEVDQANLSTGEMRTLKDEDIKFRVTFMKFGDYTFKTLLDDVEMAESVVTVEEPEVPVEPVDSVEVIIIQKPEGSNVSVDQVTGTILYNHPEKTTNDFWVSYYQSSTTDGTANAYSGIRFVAPEGATHYRVVSQGPESSYDTDVTEIETDSFIDWYFAIAKSNNVAQPESGTFEMLTTKDDNVSYQLSVSFYIKKNGNPVEIYNKNFTTTLTLAEEENPDVPVEPASVFELVMRHALTGYTNAECIKLYGVLSGWTGTQTAEAIEKYNEDLGQFCLDEGLITTQLEKALINYCAHYTLIDSVVKMGIEELEQNRAEFENVILSVPKGIEEVIKALGSSGTTIVTPDEDLNKPDTNIVITASETPVTGKKDITGKSIVVKSMTADSAAVNMVSTGNVSIKNYEASGELKKSTSNAQLKINTPGNVSIASSTMGMKGYNCIEIGLTKTIDLPDVININDIDFTADLSNNAILIFGTKDNATVNISNCHFGKLSNAIRLSNRTNASGVTVNISNCTVEQWDADPVWHGFLILQDYTSGSVAKEEENNLFAPDKITLNISNCYGPDGKKIYADDLSKVCGTKDENQLIYVWNSYGETIPYGDGSRYPTINFK